MAASLATERPSPGTLCQAQDVLVPAKVAFEFLCAVEKWPVWLSFLRSARRVETRRPIALGSEIAIRSTIPGAEEELFEVEHYVEGFVLALVGAYSVRRRIEMRVEAKSTRSKLVVRLDYPTYGGAVSALVDRLTARRRLDSALCDSLVHFKGLVEHGAAVDDFGEVIEQALL
ncbi:MAG: hypothetical protein JOY59_10415 [Candidatus Eremiobacteraeota bacterium]|nr:hypothetical protein [Candidatus Eremiobacteraeota bacterium]